MRIFIVFRDSIYASGLRATFSAAPGVDAVGHASSIARAWEDEALAEADVVLLDADLGGAVAFIQEVTIQSCARVLLCLHNATTAQVLDAMAHGAGGAVARDLATPETLLAATSAVAVGIHALDSEVLRTLTASTSPHAHGRANGDVPTGGQFSVREQLVLSLVAGGLSNRQIAERLSYSERTIKTVLHDVVTKLGVKSRSEAVALAVRERMI